MTWTTQVILNFSIAFPAVAGVGRLHNMRRTYIPFVALMIAGLISETVSFFLILSHRSNQLVYVLFSLAEAILLVYQFRRWGSFHKRTWVFHGLVSMILALWIIDFFAIGNIKHFNSFYLIIMSLLIIFLSITHIPERMIEKRNRLMKDPVFLICVALAAYYSVAILVEAFWMYGYKDTKLFRVSIHDLHTYINAACNVIFAIAILWVPTRSRFLQQ